MKIDLSNKNLRKLDHAILKQSLKAINEQNQSVQYEEYLVDVALFDNNHLSKLENFEKFINLKNVSYIKLSFKNFMGFNPFIEGS